MIENKTKKVLIDTEIECPWCKKRVKIKHIKEVIEAPVKGEYNEYIDVAKSEQTKLNT